MSAWANPLIIPRDQHPLSRKQVSRHALKVLYRLREGGYQAYLVGGCIRDILLDESPKDFDVVTNALPEQINALFRNCRLIGRRFRLAHIVFGRDVIEVATFRATPIEGQGINQRGRILQDNVYGTIEQDVMRRDFTINALYYNIDDFSIVDYVGAMEDLQKRQIRLLGDPLTRYQEDPVRALRAARFAAKLNFELAPATLAAIAPTAHLLASIPSARLFEELLKLFQTGHGVASLEKLQQFGLLEHLLPDLYQRLETQDRRCQALLSLVLQNTDERVNGQNHVNPAFLLTAFMWYSIHDRAMALCGDDARGVAVMHYAQAADEIIAEQSTVTMIPKRFVLMMKDICAMQVRLLKYSGKRALKVLQHQRFRAAYDLLLLRVGAGEVELAERAEFWTKVQTLPEAEQLDKLNSLESSGKKSVSPRKRRRNRGGKRGPKSPNVQKPAVDE